MDEKWLSTAEVSAGTGIPQSTWRYWRHRGEGPRCYKVGRRVLYKRAEVEAWMESGAVEPRNEPLRAS